MFIRNALQPRVLNRESSRLVGLIIHLLQLIGLLWVKSSASHAEAGASGVAGHVVTSCSLETAPTARLTAITDISLNIAKGASRDRALEVALSITSNAHHAVISAVAFVRSGSWCVCGEAGQGVQVLVRRWRGRWQSVQECLRLMRVATTVEHVLVNIWSVISVSTGTNHTVFPTLGRLTAFGAIAARLRLGMIRTRGVLRRRQDWSALVRCRQLVFFGLRALRDTFSTRHDEVHELLSEILLACPFHRELFVQVGKSLNRQDLHLSCLCQESLKTFRNCRLAQALPFLCKVGEVVLQFDECLCHGRHRVVESIGKMLKLGC